MFDENERRELLKMGFLPENGNYVSREFKRTLTVVKNDVYVYSFELHIDYELDDDELEYDLLRANNNKSMYDLSWDELLEELKGVE